MQLQQLNYTKLPTSFYNKSNVVLIAKQLLGKLIVTNFNNQLTIARIVETEAYNGVIDKASHAYNNKRTKRTEIMYAPASVAYVYLCYGIHQMFNIVTNKANIPHAILVRAAQPINGINIMLQRTQKAQFNNTLTKGPGNVAKALGIHTTHTGISLQSNQLFIASDNFKIPKSQIITTARIGVNYAQEHALLPYRFFVQNNKFVSGNKKQNIAL